jgi:6-phosphogluconolactonase
MSTPKLPGQVITLRDGAAVATEAATRLGRALTAAIAERGKASLALSGGNTPRPAYEQLAAQPGVDWAKVTVLWIDERAVPPDHARSNYRLAKESLLSRAPIPPGQVHRMVGEASDLEAAARDYERVLANVGVIDVAVLGIGDDGHTASLFPGERAVLVRDRTALAIAAAPALEREARLTVTAPVIERIGSVLVLAVGKAKHGPLERVAAEAGSLEETPSRVMRSVPAGALAWILDEAAAGG